MAPVQKRCVFCGGKKDKIILFNPERLDKCLGILKIRQANNLVGCNVKLQTILSESEGYHSKCLNNFTALKSKYRQTNNESVASGSEHNILGPSTFAVMNENIENVEEFAESICEADASFAAAESEDTPICTDVAEDEEVEGDASEDICENPTGEAKVEDRKCIFCKLERKKHKGRIHILNKCTKEDTIKKLKTKAVELNDLNLMLEIDSRLSQGHSIFYHNFCSIQLYTRFRANETAQKNSSEWKQIRDKSRAAFEKICLFVEESIILKKNVHFIDFLRNMFVEFLTQEYQGVELTSTRSFCTRYLEERLLKKYPKKIVVVQGNYRKIVKPYAGVALEDDAIKTAEDKAAIEALNLRRSTRTVKESALQGKNTDSK